MKSAVFTEVLVSMLAAWGACFAQQPFDYMKPVNTEAANAELDAIKFKSLTEFLRPDPKSRIQQGTESDAYFKEYKAIGDVSESSRRQHDLPNHHERCFAPLTIYHHLHVPFSLVAGATDGHSAPSSASYWGYHRSFQMGMRTICGMAAGRTGVTAYRPNIGTQSTRLIGSRCWRARNL